MNLTDLIKEMRNAIGPDEKITFGAETVTRKGTPTAYNFEFKSADVMNTVFRHLSNLNLAVAVKDSRTLIVRL